MKLIFCFKNYMQGIRQVLMSPFLGLFLNVVLTWYMSKLVGFRGDRIPENIAYKSYWGPVD